MTTDQHYAVFIYDDDGNPVPWSVQADDRAAAIKLAQLDYLEWAMADEKWPDEQVKEFLTDAEVWKVYTVDDNVLALVTE